MGLGSLNNAINLAKCWNREYVASLWVVIKWSYHVWQVPAQHASSAHPTACAWWLFECKVTAILQYIWCWKLCSAAFNCLS